MQCEKESKSVDVGSPSGYVLLFLLINKESGLARDRAE